MHVVRYVVILHICQRQLGLRGDAHRERSSILMLRVKLAIDSLELFSFLSFKQAAQQLLVELRLSIEAQKPHHFSRDFFTLLLLAKTLGKVI